MPSPPRTKGYVWTINNPTLGDLLDIEALKLHATYFVFGREQGNGGTNHLQGYALFMVPKTRSSVSAILKRAFIERQRGTNEQAAEYCKKDGDYEEFGTLPVRHDGGGRTQREQWKLIVELSERGELGRIRDEFPGIYFRSFDRIRSLRIRSGDILNGELEHEWWYGPSGTGKSKQLWAEYPNHFQKELNKWWCAYEGQEVVAIEEWSPKNECTGSQLKIWADRYPFTGQVKGGSLCKIRPRKIIVLSNYTIDQCFPLSEDSEPLKRRFKVVHFPSIFSPTREQRDWVDSEMINNLLNLTE